MSELVIDGVKFRQSGLNNIVLLHGKHKLSIAQHVSPMMKDDHGEPIYTHEVAWIGDDDNFAPSEDKVILYNPTPLSLINALSKMIAYLNEKD